MKKIIKYSLRVVLVLFVLLNIITAFHAYKFTHFYDASEANFKRQADKTKWDMKKSIVNLNKELINLVERIN